MSWPQKLLTAYLNKVNIPMRIYKVFSGAEYYATVCLQNDGQKVWTFAPEWKDFWVDADKQKMIGQAIDRYPDTAIFKYENFTIRQTNEEHC